MKKLTLFTILSVLAFNFVTGQDRTKYDALIKEASSLYDQKNYLQSGQKYAEAFVEVGGNGTTDDRYNAACSWAMAKLPDSAFVQLSKITIEGRYTNLAHITTDTDLSILHNDKRWEKIIAAVTSNKEKVASAIAKMKDSIYDAQSKIEGVKYLSVMDGKYKVWSKKSGTGKIKLLLLHGGPGTPPEYFENFSEKLGKDYTVYTYSQLGTYFSDEPEDTSLANVLSAADQTEEVRKALNLDDFYLLGHSWGAFLATVYTAKYQSHVKGMIFSNSDIYATGANQSYQGKLIADIVERIPEYKQYADSIRSDKLTNYSNPELMGKIMQQALPVFFKEHYCRTDPMPDALVRSKVHSQAGKNMYNNYLTGSMNDFDYEPYMRKITVPVLFLGSKNDYMPPGDYEKMKAIVGSKYSKIYICPNGSHFDMWDDPENYFRELNAFINDTYH